MEKKKLHAVHDDDLSSLLESLGIHDALRARRIPCFFCKEPVSEQNLHALLPYQKKVCVTCDKPDCVKALNLHLQER